MAGRALVTNKAPRVAQAQVRVPLTKISLLEGVSGWREVDPDRVSELLRLFDAGQFGQNIFRSPRLLQVIGAHKP